MMKIKPQSWERSVFYFRNGQSIKYNVSERYLNRGWNETGFTSFDRQFNNGDYLLKPLRFEHK